jgi:phage anti-repressor protein
MITPKLTENIVFDLVNSVDEFPIDFDLAWKWLGFSRKDSAKRSLSRCGFIPGIDYYVVSPPDGGDLNSTYQENIENIDISLDKSDSSQQIVLNVECFKSWGMMAATQNGKEVRKYFLQCERKMKQLAANPVRTDWTIADLMENDVLASAVAALSTIFHRLGKEKQEGKPNDINYTSIGDALWVAAMEIQTPSPNYDEEAKVFPPEVEFDLLRWCSQYRDALVMLSPIDAAKFMTEVAEKNPGSGYFHSFPTSMVIPGYQRGDDEALAIAKQVASAASNQQQKNIQQQKKIMQRLRNGKQ